METAALPISLLFGSITGIKQSTGIGPAVTRAVNRLTSLEQNNETLLSIQYLMYIIRHAAACVGVPSVGGSTTFWIRSNYPAAYVDQV